jgi:hypothetical protein
MNISKNYFISRILSKKKYFNKFLSFDEWCEELAIKGDDLTKFIVLIRENSDIFAVENGKIILLKKYATQSVGEPYLCQKNWDSNSRVQCGSKGVVFSKNSSYKTAFFEYADSDKFIRGEGLTIEDAENDAFIKLEKISNCKNHVFERRSYTNGAAVCRHCNLFKSKVFEPLSCCSVCNTPTNFYIRKDKNLCEQHYFNLSYEELDEHSKIFITKSIFINKKNIFNKLIQIQNEELKETINRGIMMLPTDFVLSEDQLIEFIEIFSINQGNYDILNEQFKKFIQKI